MSRAWVKLWVGEWLDGTTRYEMSGAQRAFWIDLLAMGGRSRQPGVICAGQSGDRVIGYPLSVFQGLDAGGELDIPATLQLFEACGKIRVEVTQENPVRLLKIEILNWNRYQSEYQRQKGYRKSDKASDRKRAKEVTPQNTKKLPVEGEVEGEVEERGTAAAASLKECWRVLGVSLPIGALQFQSEWEEFFGKRRDLPVAQVMEEFIQFQQRRPKKVPPQFYEAKHALEGLRSNGNGVSEVPILQEDK